MKIRIANENDRLSVAAILVKNGYQVRQDREKVDGKRVSTSVLIFSDTRVSSEAQP